MPRPRLDAGQFAPSVAPSMFVRLLDLLAELGVAPQRLCTGLGCTVEDLRRGEQISNRQALRMIRRALRLTGRADLGLELGSRENFSDFGLPGFAMSAARTMSEAVEISRRYQNQTGAVSTSTHEYVDDCVAVIVDSNLNDDSVLPFVIEEFFASVLAITRQLVSDRFQLRTLEVAYPEPAYAERYRQMFGCPVHFASARNRARIECRWLNMSIASHSAVMAAQLGARLEQQAQARALPPRTTATVEQLLLRSGNAKLSIDQVAGALQLSVRTLRRRLSEDGSSFRTLCERIRVESARRLLGEQGMTVAAAAERLGFSDARTFRRAFKRWLGQVPGKMRQATLSAGHHAPPGTSTDPTKRDRTRAVADAGASPRR
jgi:AraC-like DNA-binding protein